MKSDDNLIRVGGVGTGRVFCWAHAAVFPRLLGKARLVGFYDIDPSRTEAARDDYVAKLNAYAEEHPEAAENVKANLAELRVHGSLESLLEQVDVIDVCTTTRGRMDAAVAALEAGVHSMVEKPMARTWTEADRAARAFREKPDVFCQLNDDNAFQPRYLLIRDLLRQDVIGRVQSWWFIRGSGLESTTVLRSQADALSNGGGCLMDYGAHGLAGAWHALGKNYKPVKVETVDIRVRCRDRVLEGQPWVMEVDDNAQFKVLFEDPETGSWLTIFMEASWSGGSIGPTRNKDGTHKRLFLRVEGDRGIVDGGLAEGVKVTHWDGGETLHPLKPPVPGEHRSFYDEIDTFLDCVRTNTPPEIDVHFGAEIIAICDAAYLSAIRGETVTLDELKDFCRSYVNTHGDNVKADEALLMDLLKPYRRSG